MITHPNGNTLVDIDKEYQLLSVLMDEPGLCDKYKINKNLFTAPIRQDAFRVIQTKFQSGIMGSTIGDLSILAQFLEKENYSIGETADLSLKMVENYTPSWYWDQLFSDLNDLHLRRTMADVAERLGRKAFEGGDINLSILSEGVEELKRQREPIAQVKDFYTAEEIGRMTFPPINYLVADIIPPGLCFLAGRPKAGKSWLALQIAYAVSQGGQVIGKQCRKSGVFIYALEDNLRRLNWRTTQQGWNFDRLTSIKFKLLESFTDLSGCGRDLTGADLLIIDTFTRATGKDQVDPVQMREVLSPLQRAAISQDKTILVIDHMPKAGQGRDSYNNVINDLYGSVSKSGIADTILGLYRDNEGVGGTLNGTGRDIGEFELPLTWDTEAWAWQSLAPGTVVDKLGYSDNRHGVLSAIVEAEDISQLDIAAVTGMNKGTVSRVINELVSSGYVLKYVEGKRILYQPSVTGRVDILPMWDGRLEKAGTILQGALI
jgi:hypothetical protein